MVGGAVLVVAGVAALGSPGWAQLPTLPPVLGTSSTTAPSGTTSTTIVLPIEQVLTPGSTAPGSSSTAPPSSILPLPTTAPVRKTTTYKPPPIPPSTPAKALPGPAKTPRATAAPRQGASANQEAGEGDTGFQAALPFDTSGADSTAGDTTMELGIHAAAANHVRPVASVAAALLAFVMFGIALILRSEVRKRPAYAGGGDFRRRSKDLYDWTYDDDL